MNTGVISVRYARALMKSTSSNEERKNVYDDMNALSNAYIEVAKLRKAIDAPMMPKEQKQQLLEAACGGNPCQLTTLFIKMVLKEGREELLQFMANSYISLYREQQNIVESRLTTAVDIPDSTKEKMRQMIEKRANAKVEIETEVNPDIIGGFILQYDTYRMDASVRTQLRSIMKELN